LFYAELSAVSIDVKHA